MEDRERRLQEAHEALEQEDFDTVLALLERSARRGTEDAETAALYGLALYYVGEGLAAEPHLDRALAAAEADAESGADLAPEIRAEIEMARAVLHFQQGEPEAAARRLRALAEAEPEVAEIHHWLGRVLDWWAEERPELREEAARALATTTKLAPEEYPLPVELGEKEFERVLQAAIERLPEPVMRAAEEVAILVERYPSPELLSDAGSELTPDLLGLFTGTPLPERSTWDSGRQPDVIHLFRRNLEFMARDDEELREEIRVTLLHEVGHYLGMDEPDLERLGLE